jgi:hypothetical protein
MVAGVVLSQMWEPVHGQPLHGQPLHGQPFGFSVEAPQIAPQVVVSQPAAMPEWFVDFVPISPQIRAIAIVNAEAKKILVYHWNTTDGGLQLLSVRNIQPDLMLDQYNARSPLPDELRQEIQRIEQTRQNR